MSGYERGASAVEYALLLTLVVGLLALVSPLIARLPDLLALPTF